MRKMQSIGKSVGVILILLFLQTQGIGLSIPEAMAKDTTPEIPQMPEKRELKVVPAAPKAPQRAGRIVGIQIEDEANQTTIRVLGDGTFQGYQFHKLGENRFLLELPGIKSDAPRASVPTKSKRLQKIYIEKKDMQSTNLVGTLQVSLARHTVSESGNNLVLVLYPSKDQPSKITHQQAPQPIPQPILPPEQQASSSSPVLQPAVTASQPPEMPEPQQSAQVPQPVGLPQPIVSGPTPDMVSPLQPTPAETTIPAIAAAPVQATAPDEASSQERNMLQEEMQAMLAGDQKTYVGKLISLDLQDADLINVLRLLADVSGVNIVIEPGVAGRVTLKVDKVPWDQVLDMVLAMNGLGMEEIGGVVRIAQKSKLQGEMAEREALVKAKQEQIKARQELIEAAKDFGEISTAYLYISYAPPTEVAAKINEIKSDKGKISVDERTKLIIFTDYPGRLQTARQLLSRLDRATPQVLIEARIVQVSLNASKALGFTWNFNYDNTGSNFFGNDFAVNLPTGGNTITGFNLGRIAGQTLWDLDLRISALEQSGSARIISSPKVLTLDGIAAKVTQGREVPFQSESESGGTTTEFKPANLSLEVTPSITPDNRVRMKINVSKDEFEASGAKSTRNVNTELLVESRTIIVIGGVIEESMTESENRTPGLSRVPMIGRLFKSKESIRTRSELLIFISPQIVEASKPNFTSRSQ